VTLQHAEIGFWIALTLWVIAFLVSLAALVFRRESHMRSAVIIAALGLIPHTIGIAMRWMVSERPPFISLYELVTASAWFVVATYLVVQAIWRLARPVAVAVMPVAFLAMGAALTLSPDANVLTPSLKSWWLVIHILFAMVAHGCFAVAFAAAVLTFVKKPTEASGAVSLIPGPETLDRICMQSIIYGFICHTVMVLSGSIWANKAWGRFWGWDPIEVWSLVTWLIYGLYVHLRFLPNWQGRRAAAYAVVGFLVVVFSFWGVPHLWTSIHDYTLYGKQ
jgi:cytochrome c-type biogenesis protein CcsB